MSNVAIEALKVDLTVQPRLDGVDRAHVGALEANPEAWPPLVVVTGESGQYVLVDGFHRLAAAQNLGLNEVQVQIEPAPADGDLRGLSFRLNAAHGRPLSLEDRRAEAARLLRADPATSNLEVARRTGLAPTTVQAVRERLEAGSVIASTATRVSSTGVTYTPAGSSRNPGELPGEDGGALGLLADVFSPADRRNQRRWVRYLQRLTTALEDVYEVEDLDDDEAAAQACRLVLGDEQAAVLGEAMVPPAEFVLAIGQRLLPSRPSTAAPT